MVLQRGLRKKEVERQFENAQQLLQGDFHRKFKKEGPNAAIELLKPFFRSPKNGLEDKARVFEAVRIAVVILNGLAAEEPTMEAFKPYREALMENLGSVLSNPTTSTQVKEIVIGYAAGFTVSMGYYGDAETLEEGVWTYNPSEPIVAVAHLEGADPNLSQEGISPGSTILSDPALGLLCVDLINDAGIAPSIRSVALRALERNADALGRVNLVGLAMTDASKDVRQAAILVLARGGSELLTASSALTILNSQADAPSREIAFRMLGIAASKDAGFPGELSAALGAKSDATSQWFEVALLKMAALKTGIAAYRQSKNSSILGVLVGHFDTWTKDESAQELVALFGDEAARLDVRDLAPALRAALSVMTNASLKAQLEKHLGALTR